MSDLIPTNTVAKYGVFMVAGIGGAVLLLVLKALPWIFGLIAGAIVLFLGLGVLSSKKTRDTFPGVLCVAAGALAILSKLAFLGGLADVLLWLGALALLAVGIWNGVKFVLGLKSRS